MRSKSRSVPRQADEGDKEPPKSLFGDSAAAKKMTEGGSLFRNTSSSKQEAAGPDLMTKGLFGSSKGAPDSSKPASTGLFGGSGATGGSLFGG